MCEGEEALMEVIEKLQRQMNDTHYALGSMNSEIRRIKDKYHTYWSTLSPDAVPRPDMLRSFQTEMDRLINGCFNQ